MANPSPEMNALEERAWEAWAIAAGVAYRDRQHGLCFYDGGTKQMSWRTWQGARATPPSPSTAPEVDELPAPPTLPRYLLDMIGEYGMARTDSVGQLEVQHRWEILIGGIKRYASEYGRALASRPAEVDDEGLPPLPKKRGTIYQGNYWTDCDKADPPGVPLADIYTAEQYRQGQRDAVAADRARREKEVGHD